MWYWLHVAFQTTMNMILTACCLSNNHEYDTDCMLPFKQPWIWYWRCVAFQTTLNMILTACCLPKKHWYNTTYLAVCEYFIISLWQVWIRLSSFKTMKTRRFIIKHLTLLSVTLVRRMRTKMWHQRWMRVHSSLNLMLVTMHLLEDFSFDPLLWN